MKRGLCFTLMLLLVTSLTTTSFAGFSHCDYHPNAPLVYHDEISYDRDFDDDGIHHRKVWAAWNTCSICGEYVGSGGDVYRDEKERHSFVGNTCTLCGYRRASSTPTPEELQTEAIQRINQDGNGIIGKRAEIMHDGNVRARASRYSTDMGSVFPNESYEIVSYEFGTGNSVWLQIMYRNNYGWISASLARISGKGATGTGHESTDRWYIGRDCRITSSSGRARMNAGTSYPVVEYVGRNEVYTILDIDYASDGTLWFKIMKDGNLCWISSGIATTN